MIHSELDAEIEEYLIWKGCTATLESFLREKGKVAHDFRPDAVITALFGALDEDTVVPFLTLFESFEDLFFARASPAVVAAAAKLKSNMLKLFLLKRHRCRDSQRVVKFFERFPHYSEDPEFLPFLTAAFAAPAGGSLVIDPYSSPAWEELLRVSAGNLFSTVIRARRVPRLLEHSSLGQERRMLQSAVGALSEEVKALSKALQQSRQETMQWRAQALDLAGPRPPPAPTAEVPDQPGTLAPPGSAAIPVQSEDSLDADGFVSVPSELEQERTAPGDGGGAESDYAILEGPPAEPQPPLPDVFRRESFGTMQLKQLHCITAQRGELITACRFGPRPGLCALASACGDVRVFLYTSSRGEAYGDEGRIEALPGMCQSLRSLFELDDGAGFPEPPAASQRRSVLKKRVLAAKARDEPDESDSASLVLSCGPDTVVSCVAWVESAEQLLLLCGTTRAGIVKVWDIRALTRGAANCSADIFQDPDCVPPECRRAAPVAAPDGTVRSGPSAAGGAMGAPGARDHGAGDPEPQSALPTTGERFSCLPEAEADDGTPFPCVTALAWNPYQRQLFAYAAGPAMSALSLLPLASKPRGERPPPGCLGLFDMRTRKLHAALRIDPAPCVIHCLRFNHNATLLIAGGSDGMLRVYDTSMAKCIINWRAHAAAVTSACFTSDETGVLSAGLDGKILQSTLHQVGQRCFSYVTPSLATIRSLVLGQPPPPSTALQTAAPSSFLPMFLETQGDYFITSGTLDESANDDPSNDAPAPPLAHLAFMFRLKTPAAVHVFGGHSKPVRACDLRPCGHDERQMEILTAASDCVRFCVAGAFCE